MPALESIGGQYVVVSSEELVRIPISLDFGEALPVAVVGGANPRLLRVAGWTIASQQSVASQCPEARTRLRWCALQRVSETSPAVQANLHFTAASEPSIFRSGAVVRG
jgi:hypothetical protein